MEFLIIYWVVVESIEYFNEKIKKKLAEHSHKILFFAKKLTFSTFVTEYNHSDSLTLETYALKSQPLVSFILTFLHPKLILRSLEESPFQRMT